MQQHTVVSIVNFHRACNSVVVRIRFSCVSFDSHGRFFSDTLSPWPTGKFLRLSILWPCFACVRIPAWAIRICTRGFRLVNWRTMVLLICLIDPWRTVLVFLNLWLVGRCKKIEHYWGDTKSRWFRRGPWQMAARSCMQGLSAILSCYGMHLATIWPEKIHEMGMFYCSAIRGFHSKPECRRRRIWPSVEE